MPNSFDLVVIGAGPAGYVGAIRAAQLGMSVACVERDKLGGICNNWGCIPTKALLANAELYHKLRHDAADWGIAADNIRHDWSKVISRSRGIADTGDRGITSLFKKNKVTSLKGVATITRAEKGNCSVEVRDEKTGQTQTLACKHVLIATGGRPRELPFAPFDGDRVISYKHAMALPQQPKDLIILGAGAIGMEFAYFFNAFGTKVTVVEMLDRALPNEDSDVSAAVAKSFRSDGVTLLTGHKTLAVKPGKDRVDVTVAPTADEAKKSTLTAERLLVAIGVRGNCDALVAPGLTLDTVKDHIKVDYHRRGADYATSLPGVYAVGDVIGPPWLAHVASEEAIVCVERLAGHAAQDIDYDAIPGCTYCLPQVASMGQTEDKLRAAGLTAGQDYTVGKFPFAASGKARAIGATDGFIKVLADRKTGEVLGVHMVGEAVTELLAEMGVAKRLEATTDELIATMHAHPTLSEAVHEAILATRGRMIHA